MIKLKCKWSTFGGPFDGPDQGNARKDWREEDLALFSRDMVSRDAYHSRSLFLPVQPPGLPGLARALDPDASYCAMRWRYLPTEPEGFDERLPVTPPSWLRSALVTIEGPAGMVAARPVDWGPGVKTGRTLDVSPGVARRLGAKPGEPLIVYLPTAVIDSTEAAPPPFVPMDPRPKLGMRPRGQEGEGMRDKIQRAVIAALLGFLKKYVLGWLLGTYIRPLLEATVEIEWAAQEGSLPPHLKKKAWLDKTKDHPFPELVRDMLREGLVDFIDAYLETHDWSGRMDDLDWEALAKEWMGIPF